MRALLAIVSLLAAAVAGADTRLDFTLHKKGAGEGRTLLVIGGIQGDEPGGFNAASLLVTHYEFDRGSVWVVPNLNFESILKRSRGVNGDMNRKFPSVSPSDPDHEQVERIKAIITDPEIAYVMNLHDGSGFYRYEHVDAVHSPRRWGQSVIIDQNVMEHPELGALETLAQQVSAAVNLKLKDAEHAYRVKNTRTREGNAEMAKTLTYFAINNGKPAVGIEASKNLPTHDRVYYHLQVLEAYMDRLGIVYRRRFQLEPLAVKETIDNNVQVAFYGDRLFLDMADARRRLGYVPLRKGQALEFRASSPLVAILDAGKGYRVSYGNRRVTEIHPQLFEYDWSLETVDMRLDGASRSVPLGSLVEVSSDFLVEPLAGYRVNVIGWRKPEGGDESGTIVDRANFSGRFSVDRAATTFRVEIYRAEKFVGMILVRFTERPSPGSVRLRDTVS